MHINFNGFNPGFNMSIIELSIEVRLGDAVVNSQTVQVPYIILLQQCKELTEEVANDDRPMKITMTQMKDVELPNGDWVRKPCRLIFANNAYLNNFDIEE